MILRDVLLQASSHPEPTPDWAITWTASLAERLNLSASLGVCQVHIEPLSNWLANQLLDVDGMITGENQKSTANREALVQRFASLMPADRQGQTMVIDCPGMVTPWQLAIRARTHDLTIVPYYGHRETMAVAEGLAFESGRPVLLLPKPAQTEAKIERIALAWDGSRVAARAVADAMPLLLQASAVAVVQISGDKELPSSASLADLTRHFSLHGIAATSVQVPVDGGDTAATLQSFCERDGYDLLVMGAFGHSRVRQFVLGGVTRSVLNDPRLPILISH